MSKNIILIGYRGVGKTTLAKLISKKLNKKHIDTDALIENQYTMKIHQIINKFGIEYFRNIEHNILMQIKDIQDAVISTGGGIVEFDENCRILKGMGSIIWLVASPDTINNRISNDGVVRPSLTEYDPITEINTILFRRSPYYKDISDYIINTDNKSIYTCSKMIIPLSK